MMRRGGFTPGQIILVVVLVLAAVLIFSGGADPRTLREGAITLAVLLPALILSLAFHEFAHAWTANRLGDDTAKNQGRLTLDPRAHLDPMGTLMLVLTMLLFRGGFGWAKPVPVNPWRLRPGPRAGMALVGAAGPIANVLLAFLAIRLAKLLLGTEIPDEVVGLLGYFARLNVVLAVFNMIPLPPLDGYRVLLGILPSPAANSLAAIEPYGPMLLLLLVFMGGRFIGSIIAFGSGPILRILAA